jgi:hypothetical protein
MDLLYGAFTSYFFKVYFHVNIDAKTPHNIYDLPIGILIEFVKESYFLNGEDESASKLARMRKMRKGNFARWVEVCVCLAGREGGFDIRLVDGFCGGAALTSLDSSGWT